MQEEIHALLALHFAQGIGHKYAAALIAHFGSAEAVLAASLKQLMKIEGMGEIRARAIRDPAILHAADTEMSFIQAQDIQILTPASDAYPQRLRECADAPQLLFYKGSGSLNRSKKVAIIGTRKHTDYGHRATNDLIDGLARLGDLTIISGLAHGIDTIAHKAALRNQIETIGVLGHGLNMIYPVANKALSKEMTGEGGLLTEFATTAKIEKGNFPARNRIVAGVADVTVIIESDIRGGALITGYIANSYNREVAVYPGRAYDSKSSGTNMLIRKNLAALISSADDLLDLMGWQKQNKKTPVQTQLLLHLNEEEQKIIDILITKDTTHADELQKRTGMGSSQLASCLLLLEMQGLIKSLPGKQYRMS